MLSRRISTGETSLFLRRASPLQALAAAWNEALRSPYFALLIHPEHDATVLLDLRYEKRAIACRVPGRRRRLPYREAIAVLEAAQ